MIGNVFHDTLSVDVINFNCSQFSSSVLSPSGLADKDESNQPLLFRREVLTRDKGASNASSVTAPLESPVESRFISVTSLSSEDRPIAHTVNSNSSIAAMPLKPSRSPNWSDAETRFLITFWGEQYKSISQQRNAKAWDIVARLLNQKLAQCGFETFRTGQQCKGRMKSIVFDYRTAKKRINETGEIDRTCDYFDEIDAILGKSQEESSSESTGRENSNNNTTLAVFKETEKSSANDDIVIVNIPTSLALNVDTTTGLGVLRSEANKSASEKRVLQHRREPPKKRKKKASEDEEDFSTLAFLKSYMEESDRRDREFLLQMMQMDREREERTYERTMKLMMEMAKAFKTSTVSSHDNHRASNVSVTPPLHGGDGRFSSGSSRNDKNCVRESNGTAAHEDLTGKASGEGKAQGNKGSQPRQFLQDYMEESDRKDREFLLQISKMDQEREERNSEQTTRLMVEITKVFRGGS